MPWIEQSTERERKKPQSQCGKEEKGEEKQVGNCREANGLLCMVSGWGADLTLRLWTLKVYMALKITGHFHEELSTNSCQIQQCPLCVRNFMRCKLLKVGNVFWGNYHCRFTLLKALHRLHMRHLLWRLLETMIRDVLSVWSFSHGQADWVSTVRNLGGIDCPLGKKRTVSCQLTVDYEINQKI